MKRTILGALAAIALAAPTGASATVLYCAVLGAVLAAAGWLILRKEN